MLACCRAARDRETSERSESERESESESVEWVAPRTACRQDHGENS